MSDGISVDTASTIKRLIRSLILLTPRAIPNPYSALSSNNELAHATPLPFLLQARYGVAGAEPP